MATIIYHNQVFDTKYLLSQDISYIKDIYLQESLLFCQKWLQGEESFEVKTSGSTGVPKIIYPKRKAIQASIEMSRLAFGWKGKEQVLVCLHTQYIAGKMMLLRGLELDWTMYLQAPTNNPLADFEQKLDFAAFVPLQMQNILANSPEKLDLFDKNGSIIIGGASINSTLEGFIGNLVAPRIFQTYGMTETLSHIAIKQLNAKPPQKYFFPLNGVQIRLDERKCFCVKSPSTCFEEIATNDVAEIYADGSFRILGRLDNVINSGGVKIQLEEVEKEIEEVFSQIALQRRFYCIGTNDDYWGQALTLCIEGEKFPENVEISLMKLLQNLKNKYHIPKKIIYQAVFSETETGKIKRQSP